MSGADLVLREVDDATEWRPGSRGAFRTRVEPPMRLQAEAGHRLPENSEPVAGRAEGAQLLDFRGKGIE